MPPRLAALSFGYGVAFGVLKIAWIVLAAVYLYDISVETGQFEIMKESIAGITADRRLQVLLVAFCFGAFIEGAAGFGAPVAIAGAFMIGLGFQAVPRRGVESDRQHCSGGLGSDWHAGSYAGGRNGSAGIRPERHDRPHPSFYGGDCSLLAGEDHGQLEGDLRSVSRHRWWSAVSFALTQFFWSNYVDSNLVDIMGGVVSIVAALAFLRFWKPKKIWRFDYDETAARACCRPRQDQRSMLAANGRQSNSMDLVTVRNLHRGAKS